MSFQPPNEPPQPPPFSTLCGAANTPANTSSGSHMVTGARPFTSVSYGKLQDTGFPIPAQDTLFLPQMRSYNPDLLWEYLLSGGLHRENRRTQWQLVVWKRECRPGLDLRRTCDRCAVYGLQCTRSPALYATAAARRAAAAVGADGTSLGSVTWPGPGTASGIAAGETAGVGGRELSRTGRDDGPRTIIMRNSAVPVMQGFEMVRGGGGQNGGGGPIICCDQCFQAGGYPASRCSAWVRNTSPQAGRVGILNDELAARGVLGNQSSRHDGRTTLKGMPRYSPRCLACLVEDVAEGYGDEHRRKDGRNLCLTLENDAKCRRCREQGRDCVWGRELIDLNARDEPGSWRPGSDQGPGGGGDDGPGGGSGSGGGGDGRGRGGDDEDNDDTSGHGQAGSSSQQPQPQPQPHPAQDAAEATDDGRASQAHNEQVTQDGPRDTPELVIYVAWPPANTDSAPQASAMPTAETDDEDEDDENEPRATHQQVRPSTLRPPLSTHTTLLAPDLTATPSASGPPTPASKTKCRTCENKIIAGYKGKRSAKSCETDEANGRGCRQCVNYGLVCVYQGFVMPRNREARNHIGFTPCDACRHAAVTQLAAATMRIGTLAAADRAALLCDRKQPCDRCTSLGIQCGRSPSENRRVIGLIGRDTPSADLEGFYLTSGKQPGTFGRLHPEYGTGRGRRNWVMPDDYHFQYLAKLGIPQPASADEIVEVPGRRGPVPLWLQKLRHDRGQDGAGGSAAAGPSSIDATHTASGDDADDEMGGVEDDDDDDDEEAVEESQESFFADAYYSMPEHTYEAPDRQNWYGL
ncbi:uncharacterized protein B0I36DRAFT_363092 [Microdochium trichocladiopsis]|uniref:Uncharacterized protein n=1 Tax=Microdochium trichocladiopsis TaxID=1682393 RepID=A0A9P8Y9H1_9PEZI|nr:uncharacterized protein B0I36DRAFT_363092 [Microdochium trichocladiopsis]KAH7031401.1 hypothetical protein B0I36DRAFT_363092 [Microdochium trichocladiopsis]